MVYVYIISHFCENGVIVSCDSEKLKKELLPHKRLKSNKIPVSIDKRPFFWYNYLNILVI